MAEDVHQGDDPAANEDDPELLSHLYALVKRYRQLGRPARVSYEINGVRVTLEEPFLGSLRRGERPER